MDGVMSGMTDVVKTQDPSKVFVRPMRPTVILSGLTLTDEDAVPRKKPASRKRAARAVQIFKAASGKSDRLAQIRKEDDVYSFVVESNAALSTAFLAFTSRGVNVENEDFSQQFVLTEVIQQDVRLAGSKYRVAFQKRTRDISADGFFCIPANPYSSDEYKRGPTMLETMLHFLYLIDAQGDSSLGFPEVLRVPCLGSTSRSPDRVFVVSLHRPTPAEVAKVVVTHARTGDRLQHALVLETVVAS